MCSVRFTFAGARQCVAVTLPRLAAGSPAVLRRPRARSRTRLGPRRPLGQAVLDLLQDLRQVVRLRAEIPRVVPLEMRLGAAVDAPVGVAEMVVDDRIARLQL